jgi:DNA modification methylase
VDAATTDRKIEYLPLEALRANPANPKAHATEVIDTSLGRFGYVEPVVQDGRTGMIVSGHGRTETLRVMRERGDSPPDGVLMDSDGGWLVPVTVGWSSRSDAEAKAALVALNRSTEVGGWDDAALADILDDLAAVEGGLLGVGFEAEDVALLRADLDAIADAEGPSRPVPRTIRPPVEGPGTVVVHHGDNLDVLAAMEPDSIDAVVTDPPYGLGFMGLAWDRSGTPKQFATWTQTWAAAVLRVLKPGGHLIAFGGTRTHHRLMVGIEDAGFEIRDCGVWLYRSGFPKSLDVSKAIDGAAGAERGVVGHGENFGASAAAGGKQAYGDYAGLWDVTTPATEAAVQWDGWGTGLKPAIEPWVLARRPVTEGNVAANVLRWGTGALNIEGTRAEMTQEDREKFARGSEAWHRMALERDLGHKPADVYGVYGITDAAEAADAGRWPANVLTGEPDDDLRFFRLAVGAVADYPKASAAEKPWVADGVGSTYTPRCTLCGKWSLNGRGDTCRCEHPVWAEQAEGLHPTVKPVALIRHLVRLVTPPGGTVLDPFAGTGTTGEAAVLEGFDAVLIEREAAYLPLIRARLGDDVEVAS